MITPTPSVELGAPGQRRLAARARVRMVRKGLTLRCSFTLTINLCIESAVYRPPDRTQRCASKQTHGCLHISEGRRKKIILYFPPDRSVFWRKSLQNGRTRDAERLSSHRQAMMPWAALLNRIQTEANHNKHWGRSEGQGERSDGVGDRGLYSLGNTLRNEVYANKVP